MLTSKRCRHPGREVSKEFSTAPVVLAVTAALMVKEVVLGGSSDSF